MSNLPQVPKSIVIIGGGYIAVEFAGAPQLHGSFTLSFLLRFARTRVLRPAAAAALAPPAAGAASGGGATRQGSWSAPPPRTTRAPVFLPALPPAGIFAGLGSEVHLVYRQPLPLRGFDEEVRKEHQT